MENYSDKIGSLWKLNKSKYYKYITQESDRKNRNFAKIKYD